MRVLKPIILVGMIIFASGIVFHLQGQAIVGPQTSFMYSNPDWISYGMQITVTGMIIVIIGISLFVKFKRQHAE